MKMVIGNSTLNISTATSIFIYLMFFGSWIMRINKQCQKPLKLIDLIMKSLDDYLIFCLRLSKANFLYHDATAMSSIRKKILSFTKFVFSRIASDLMNFRASYIAFHQTQMETREEGFRE